MSLRACSERTPTTFRTSYKGTPSSMRTRSKSIGSSASYRTRSGITIERFAPAMFPASLRFALRSFPVLFLRDALNGFSFRTRWDHIVRIKQMLNRLLLFGKKFTFSISLRSHLVPFDILRAFQGVSTNFLAFLLFSLRLYTAVRSFRLSTVAFPRGSSLFSFHRICFVLLIFAISLFISFPRIYDVQSLHKVFVIKEFL